MDARSGVLSFDLAVRRDSMAACCTGDRRSDAAGDMPSALRRLPLVGFLDDALPVPFLGVVEREAAGLSS